MTIRKPESFMRGALLLSLAALVSRLLGALYKPIIAWIFAPFDGHKGAVGIGLTQVPLSAYMVIFSFTSVGLNAGIARLVSERMALGDVRGARRVFRLSLRLMAALGLIGSVALWFGAPRVSAWLSPNEPDTIIGFRATAPALYFMTIMSAYRGLYQGLQVMTPYAYSQIIEQVVRVVTGIALTFVLVRQSVAWGAAGFNMGDVTGGVAGLVYLLVLVDRAGKGLWAAPVEAATLEPAAGSVRPESSGSILRRIFRVAAPITIVGAVVPLMMTADSRIVFRTLNDAAAQYGLLTNAFMIVHLPAVFTMAIYLSLLPAITEAITLGRVDVARARARQAFRMTMLVAVPSQVGLWAMATGVYALIYRDTAGGGVMAAMSWSTLAIMLQQTTSGVLQGIGKMGLPLSNFVLGAIVKVILSVWWTPTWGIIGTAYATAVGFGLAALLNLVSVERLLGRTIEFSGMILKPVAAAVVMGGAIVGIQRLAPAQSDLMTVLLIGAGVAVYGLVLLLIGGLRRQDLELIPRVGRPAAALLERARLLR